MTAYASVTEECTGGLFDRCEPFSGNEVLTSGDGKVSVGRREAQMVVYMAGDAVAITLPSSPTLTAWRRAVPDGPAVIRCPQTR